MKKFKGEIIGAIIYTAVILGLAWYFGVLK